MPKKPEMVIYRPKAGREAELLALVLKQWPASFKAGLATSEPATVFRTTDKRSGKVAFVEFFSWVDEGASTKAHSDPIVGAVWGPMMPLIEGMEISTIELMTSPVRAKAQPKKKAPAKVKPAAKTTAARSKIAARPAAKRRAAAPKRRPR